MLVMRNVATNDQAILPVMATAQQLPLANAAISFNRYGAQSFVALIKMGDTRYAVARGKAEKNAERAFVAQTKGQIQTSEVRD